MTPALAAAIAAATGPLTAAVARDDAGQGGRAVPTPRPTARRPTPPDTAAEEAVTDSAEADCDRAPGRSSAGTTSAPTPPGKPAPSRARNGPALRPDRRDRPPLQRHRRTGMSHADTSRVARISSTLKAAVAARSADRQLAPETDEGMEDVTAELP